MFPKPAKLMEAATSCTALTDRVRRCVARPLVPLVCFALLAALSMRHKSATYDEPLLLASGARILRTWDVTINAENPPLMKVFYALPTLLFPGFARQPPPADLAYAYDMPAEFAYGNAVLFSGRDPRRVLFACRCMGVLVGVALGAALYLCGRRLLGRGPALAALWLYALSPNLLAHTRLVTPDVASTLCMFLTTVALHRLLLRARWRDAGLFGLALAGALLTKFTGVLLLGCIPLQAGLFLWLGPRHRRFGRRCLMVLAGGAIALLLIGAAYGFRGMGQSLSELPVRSSLVQRLRAVPVVRSLPLPVPEAYVRGFDIVAHNNRPGFPNVFLGTAHRTGGRWWSYYLVALLTKVPVPVLAALVAGLCSCCRRQARHREIRVLYAVVPVALLLNFSFVAYRQLGLRYILPCWPFGLLLAGYAVGRWRPVIRKTRPGRWGEPLLWSWLALGSLWCFPDYLSYFNEWTGGAAGGQRLLVSSNLDWGQDLPALAQWQENHGNPDMYVLYYGSVPPRTYDITVYRWGRLPLPPYVAISVTQLYLAGDIPLVRVLRDNRDPVARAGKSIQIYRLDPAAIADIQALAHGGAP